MFLGLSGYLVIHKELKHSPVELMKGDLEQARMNLLERSLNLDRLKFKTKFQIREQLRSVSRLAFLLGGCAVATMLMLYGFTIKSSLETFTTTNLTGTYHFQYEYIFKTPRSEPVPVGAEPFSAPYSSRKPTKPYPSTSPASSLIHSAVAFRCIWRKAEHQPGDYHQTAGRPAEAQAGRHIQHSAQAGWESLLNQDRPCRGYLRWQVHLHAARRL